MARNDNQKVISQYLLGELSDDEQQTFEERLLKEHELWEMVNVVEDELIDEYLAGSFSESRRKTFEEKFLVSPDRKEQLRFAKAVNRTLVKPISTSNPDGWVTRLIRWLQQYVISRPVLVAAGVVLVAGLGFGIWHFNLRQSEVDRSLIALNAAYSQQRPTESRITQFNYAPFVTARGPDTYIVNEPERQRAELILLEGLSKNPNADIRHALGKVYLAKNDPDRAIEQFETALKNDPNNAQIYADLGAAWLEKGKTKLDRTAPKPESGKGMEEIGRSLEYLNKALEIDSTSLEALFNRALAEQNLTLFDQAEQDWREYLKRDSTSPWAEEARKYLKLLEERKAKTAGTRDQLISDFLKAYETQNDDAAWTALSLSRSRMGNSVVETLLDDFLNLASGGRIDEANAKLKIISYAGALEVKRVQDRFTSDLARGYVNATPAERLIRAQARGMMKSAVGLYNKGEWQQAIDLFSKSRELFAKSGDEVENLFAETLIGYSYLRIPDPQKAIPIFERLSKVFEAKRYRSFYAQSVFAMADAVGSLNEFSKVLEHTGKSLVLSEQIQDHANVIRCLTAQTSAQIVVGNHSESLAAVFRALSLAETIPPDAKLTWPLYHEAAIDFYFLEMPNVSLQFENEALRLAVAAKLPFQASRSFDRLALIHERLKNFDKALEYSEQARAQGVKLSDGPSKTNVLAHSALNFGRLYRETGNPERALESYDQAIGLYQQLKLDIYQYQARKGKLLAHIQLGNDSAVEAELDTVVDWFERNREKIAEESYRNKFFDTGQNAYDIAVDFQYSRKKDPAKAFNYAEASRARSLLDLKSTGAQLTGDRQNPELQLLNSASSLKLDQIQAQLPQQSQLVQYSVMDDKVIVWVVTKDSLKSGLTMISRAELDEKIQKFSRMLAHPDSNQNEELDKLAKELHTILIKPVETYLDSVRQTAIVPDDNLSFVPFVALVSPTSSKYLIEDYAIQIASSATLFISSSAQAQFGKIDSERLLIVGNPRFDRKQFAGLPDLPGAEREAREIAKLYGATPLIGRDATAARVNESLVEADIIHLATHALTDERSPLLSKLLLSEGESKDQLTHHASRGSLQASEIYALKFPRTRLVVLSACQTGIERAYRGEGAIGLARPFIAAGVPVVVATLWPVESESTADLMISFHKHRKQGQLSTVEALRRAQLEILHNQQPGSPKNYGWAAFVVIGGYASF
jgi:CHAT domain-containing protein